MIQENIEIYSVIWIAIIVKYMDVLTTIIGTKIFWLREVNPFGVGTVIIGSGISIIMFYILTEIIRHADKPFIKEQHRTKVMIAIDAYILIVSTVAVSNIFHITLIIIGR